MHKKYTDKMYCFSPPVMLATFVIEFSLAAYTAWRYKMSTVKRLIVTSLVALGTFQLAEYMVCGGLGISGIEWARIGYISITLLPALGIHLVTSISGKKADIMTSLAYISCALFVGFYIFGTNAIHSHSCHANYAVFNTSELGGWPFSIYYYGWLLLGAFMAWFYAKDVKSKKKIIALQYMIIGYSAFIVPTTMFNIIDPSTVAGIPSIMCGFAVLFAFALVLKVLPNTCKTSSQTTKTLKNLRLKF